MLYYAVGDVHGCADALDALLDRIDGHRRAHHDGRAHRIVMLGDFVDRGPDSARVLDRCMALDQAGHVVLPGNHDQMMYEALAGRPRTGRRAAAHWWANGARSTLESYGAAPTADDYRDGFTCVPEAHRVFLKTLVADRRVYHRDDADGLFFVHAGVRPEKPLSEHSVEDLLWSRDPAFYGDAPVPWVEGLRVVHAHTPGDGPEIRAGRVGLDTGAVYGGRLTAGVFVDGALEETLSVPGLVRPA